MKQRPKFPKRKKGAWFYRIRGSYLPATWQGWLTYVPFITFLIWSGLYSIETSFSLSEAVMLVFPTWVAAAVVMTWIASKKA